jgi:hypothetical protein
VGGITRGNPVAEVRLSTRLPASTTLAASRSRAFMLVGAVFVFFFAAYVFTASGDIFSTGDTTLRVQVAENYYQHLSPSLRGYKLVNPRHLKTEFYDPRLSLGRGGRTYSTYLPGQPLMIAPFDILGNHLAAQEHWPLGPTVLWLDRMVGPLSGALEVTIFFMFAVRLGYSLRRALLLTAVFGFATSVWPDEQSVLEHTEVAFFLLLAFYFAFRFREQGKSWPYLLFAGAAMGGAAITRYQDAFLGLIALCVYLLLPSPRLTRFVNRLGSVILVGLGLLPFAIFDLWFNWIRFGSIAATGHHEKLFGYPVLKGVGGLLISPGKGILWYCPIIFLLAIVGPRFYRRYSAFTIAIATISVAFVVFYANVTFWHGDPAWGPRYIYPIVPFLILPLGSILDIRGRAKPLILAVTGLVVLASFTIQLSSVSVSQWRTWYRVIQYEEQQGHKWQWIASRYRYFWNYHESPLNFQIHGLYQLAYDQLNHSNKYEIVPPDEDPILQKMTMDYSINSWGFWWTSNEFDWWMGSSKIVLLVVALISIMAASATYLLSEAFGVFRERREKSDLEVVRTPEISQAATIPAPVPVSASLFRGLWRRQS